MLCLLEVFPTPTCHLSRIDALPSGIFPLSFTHLALCATNQKKRIRTDSRQQLLPFFFHVFCVNHVNGGCLLTSSHSSQPPHRDGRHACLVEARCTNTATLVSTVSIPKRNKQSGGSRITHQVLCGQPASDVRRTASGAAPPAPPARCRYSPAAQPSASPAPLRLGRTVALRAHAALASRGLCNLMRASSEWPY